MNYYYLCGTSLIHIWLTVNQGGAKFWFSVSASQFLHVCTYYIHSMFELQALY